MCALQRLKKRKKKSSTSLQRRETLEWKPVKEGKDISCIKFLVSKNFLLDTLKVLFGKKRKTTSKIRRKFLWYHIFFRLPEHHSSSLSKFSQLVFHLFFSSFPSFATISTSIHTRNTLLQRWNLSISPIRLSVCEEIVQKWRNSLKKRKRKRILRVE